PPAPRGVPQVEVTFDIDANGIANVSAKDLGTGKEQRITITASSGLNKDEVARMMKEAESHAEDDRKRREEIEVRNRADQAVYGALIRVPQLVAGVLEQTLGAIDRLVGAVAHLDLLAPLAVVFGVRLRFLHHPIDLVLRQAARRGDRDALLLAGPEILRRYVHDAVGVDVEGDLDLRHPPRRRRKTDEMELPERPVVARQRPLALQHVHLDARLVVR